MFSFSRRLKHIRHVQIKNGHLEEDGSECQCIPK
jgi:hypothetical protein